MKSRLIVEREKMSAPEIAIPRHELGQEREMRRDLVGGRGRPDVRQRKRAFGEDRHAKPVDEPAQVGDAGRGRAGPGHGGKWPTR